MKENGGSRDEEELRGKGVRRVETGEREEERVRWKRMERRVSREGKVGRRIRKGEIKENKEGRVKSGQG